VSAHAEQNRVFSDLAVDLVAQSEKSGIPLRVLGSVAVYLKCPRRRSFLDSDRAPFSDIDFATTSESSEEVARLLVERGCEENENWRMLRGHQRRVFYSRENITFEVFVDNLCLSQSIPLRGRLSLDYPTICLTDLLLSRVQKVRFEQKDLIDICVLLLEHELGTRGGFDLGYILWLAAGHWRWWRVWKSALSQLASGCQTVISTPEDRQAITTTLSRLGHELDSVPKTTAWRLRGLVGDRWAWHENVESA